MSYSEEYVLSDGQLLVIAALTVVGLGTKLIISRIADRRHKRQIAQLNEIFSLPSYEKP